MEKKIRLSDAFWMRYRELVRKEMIPYQWNVLNDAIDICIERERNDASIPNQKSHAIENFKIAAGRSEGEHYGWVFQDSDVYKWLEAVAYSLREKMDSGLKELADEVVELICEAQEADGYLNTYFTIMEPERKFKRLGESHELYCAGHFMEAAVAYYEATANERVLKAACRLADCIDNYFGAEDGKIHGCDGHEEVEIGLLRLYQLTGNEGYLTLSRYFLSVRGVDKDFFEKQRIAEIRTENPGREEHPKEALIHGMEQFPHSYFQMHAPVLSQETAEGHAVRLVYMCTAMADIAAKTKDVEMYAACRRIWRNIVDKRMYITGGIGSTVIGESFTLDYDLPNDTMYCETCASVGLVFFARRMLENEAKGEYADVMERALYNTVLAGMALDGKHFFYVNPLEAVPRKSRKDPGKSHVKCVRPQWLGCACCPPNLARLLASIEEYIYTEREDAILVNLFMESEAVFGEGKEELIISQTTEYPWNGQVNFRIEGNGEREVTLGIRIPAWATQYRIVLNGEEQNPMVKDGFWYITKAFADDVIELDIPMEVQIWHANPHVVDDIGQIAVSRGPFIYCLEEKDNGSNLHLLSVSADAALEYHKDEELLGGIGVITGYGTRKCMQKEEMPLYQRDKNFYYNDVQKLVWIPYYAWANRGENEMRVWIREE